MSSASENSTAVPARARERAISICPPQPVLPQAPRQGWRQGSASSPGVEAGGRAPAQTSRRSMAPLPAPAPVLPRVMTAPEEPAVHSIHDAAKRAYDLTLAFFGLAVLSPLFVLIAVMVKLSDGGDVFYRQVRVGLNGRAFRIWKFRTMVPAADKAGISVTKAGDARITPLGRVLRKTKLDELPQLINVLAGEMSLVGPRPEVPKYVDRYTAGQRAILNLKPGITDLASLRFRNEEALLANAENVEEFYMQQCVPRKMKLNLEYATRANLLSDTWIILQTVCPYWIGVLASYGLLLAASFWLAHGLIHDFAPAAQGPGQFGRELALVMGLQLACLAWRRQCRGLLSYFSIPELRQVAAALGAAAVVLLVLWMTGAGMARNVILADSLLAFCLLGGFRLGLRQWRERSSDVEEDKPANAPSRVAIIGAGAMGARLALELAAQRRFGRDVVAFFDDDVQKWQKDIHEIPVVGMPECLLQGWSEKLDEVVIAMPGASPSRVHEISEVLRKTSLKFYTVSNPVEFWERSCTA